MQPLQDRNLNHALLQLVGPMLIMLMVSSLVFFLIEVFYRGPHNARLYWVMGLFTFASVLVARISIEEGKERAQFFGIALAIATFITSLQLVEFSALPILKPVVLTGLIGVVMWTTNKLTWDCTVVDNSRDVSSSGLLERLKRTWSAAAEDVNSHESILSRIKQFFVSGSRANSPGTWVIYFSLVAFPVFGFGQWFVKPQATVWVYVLFAVYFAAALGLLLTTSLLGLERYLARRGVHVPAPIARNWMMIGGTFALLVMLLVTLLPKPGGSSSLQSALSMLTSPLKKASDFALARTDKSMTRTRTIRSPIPMVNKSIKTVKAAMNRETKKAKLEMTRATPTEKTTRRRIRKITLNRGTTNDLATIDPNNLQINKRGMENPSKNSGNLNRTKTKTEKTANLSLNKEINATNGRRKNPINSHRHHVNRTGLNKPIKP